MDCPRFLLTAPASGSGKTLLTCGLLQALKLRGLQVASFKCGPDYIDPMFHRQVFDSPSYNLDSFFCTSDIIRHLLCCHASDVDLAVIEGVMGYYDGIAGTLTKASAYEIATITDTPAILVVDCQGMSTSITALVQGFANYRQDSNIRGVLLNRMSAMLYPRVKQMIEDQTGIPVLGYLPKSPEFSLDSRHLGLILPHEIADLQQMLCRLADTLEKTLDIDAILAIARSARTLVADRDTASVAKFPVTIAVAKDEAFCFIYEDNLRYLQQCGAIIRTFSPLHDPVLPQADGILLYGGYPELYAAKLSQNKSMCDSVRTALQQGVPCLAECGGFMYLHERLTDKNGDSYPMVGAICGEIHPTDRLQRFGYVTLQSVQAFGAMLGDLKAHEFHYFESSNCGSACVAKKPQSDRAWRCMHATDRLLAGFPHLHFDANPTLPYAFLTCCQRSKDESRSDVTTD